ncbi:MAG: hypothetical protein L0228_20125 [Planctomycetes bacterium]|nr:hypothetical protein [Planctomycetota bacterium]
MSFSLRTLLLFTAASAVVFTSLIYAMPIVGDLFYTLGLLTIALSTIAAIYRLGPSRAYWVGFLVLFAGYYFHTVWPSEIRTTWIAFSDDFGVRSPGMLTTRGLSACFEGLHGAIMPGSLFNRSRSRPSDLGEQYVAFMTVGHTALAMLLGICGGTLARRLALYPAAPIRR